MKLVKKQGTNSSTVHAAVLGATIDRRSFLKRSGITAGGVAAAGTLSMSMMKKASASVERTRTDEGNPTQIRSICTHCSVGCGIMPKSRTVSGPGRNLPLITRSIMGAHCAKGASVASTVMASAA